MGKSFCFGLALGAIGGALLIVNSQKARSIVKKSQDEIKQKVSEFADEKIDEMEKANNAIKTTTRTKRV